MTKYQQRSVDVFVWDGDSIDGLREFVTPLVAESVGRVAAVPKIDGAGFLTPGDCVMKFASGGFTVCDGALFAAEYELAGSPLRPPKHVVVDFGDGHKIDIDVANTMVGPGECLRVLRDKIGTAKHDPLECTNGG